MPTHDRKVMWIRSKLRIRKNECRLKDYPRNRIEM